MVNTSISEPISKKSRGKKVLRDASKDTRKTSREVEVKGLKELEDSFEELKLNLNLKPTILNNFLKKAIVNDRTIKNHGNASDSQKDEICKTSTPSKFKQNVSFNLDLSNFGDEEDLEVSDIIDGIISRKPKYIEENIRKIDFNEFEDSLVTDDVNSSSFFITKPVEEDLFEKTFNAKEESSEDTEEYELDENEMLDEDDNKENRVAGHEDKENDSGSDNSFCDDYVPLYERLKKK